MVICVSSLSHPMGVIRIPMWNVNVVNMPRIWFYSSPSFLSCAFVLVFSMYNLGSLYLFVKADGDRQQRRSTLSLRQSQSTKLTTRIGEDNDPSTQQQRENEDIENIISRIRRGSSTLRSSTRNTTPGEPKEEQKQSSSKHCSKLFFTWGLI